LPVPWLGVETQNNSPVAESFYNGAMGFGRGFEAEEID